MIWNRADWLDLHGDPGSWDDEPDAGRDRYEDDEGPEDDGLETTEPDPVGAETGSKDSKTL
jgi:hypothetical protein